MVRIAKKKPLQPSRLKRLITRCAVAAQAKADASSAVLQYHHAVGRTIARPVEVFEPANEKTLCTCAGRYQSVILHVNSLQATPGKTGLSP
jgi:predicted metal-dependent enzyme (double-stranded beta helix superfamily)